MAPPTAPAGIDAGITITGDITAMEDLTISGRIDGKVSLPDFNLTVAAGARVKATLVARTVTVSGQVDGNILAAERIALLPGASVRGHLTSPSLLLAEGAAFTGTVDPNRSETAMHVARYRERHGQ